MCACSAGFPHQEVPLKSSILPLLQNKPHSVPNLLSPLSQDSYVEFPGIFGIVFLVISFIIIKVQWIYNVSSISVIQQNDPVRPSCLCYTAGAHWPSIPNVIVCIHQPQTPRPSRSFPLPPGNQKSALHGCDLSLFYHILDFTYK